MKIPKSFSINIFISLILGTMLGIFFPSTAPYFSWMGLVFKLSLGMIVMPIIISSLFCALESIGDLKSLKSLGGQAVSFFLFTTFAAVIFGLVVVSFFKPGTREPSSEAKEMVYALKSSDPKLAADELLLELKKTLFLNISEEQYANLKENVNSIAKQATGIDDFKNHSLSYLGALELRSKLLPDVKIETLKSVSFSDFVEKQIRSAIKNPFLALANADVVAVIVFVIVFGIAISSIGPLKERFFELNRALNLASIKIIEQIMKWAPFGVFGLLVEVVSSTGTEVFRELSLYAFCVILGLSFHLLIFLPMLNYIFTGQGPLKFLTAIKPALLVAFSTSSSNATLPLTMKCVEENLKVKRQIFQFVLPLGATINMNGTALYEAVAAVFIAQLYGVSLDLNSQVIIALTSLFAAIGTAGIPAAGTVTMALVLSAANLPVEGLGLLFVLDRPLDMCRTVVNVAGDMAGSNILHHLNKEKEVIL